MGKDKLFRYLYLFLLYTLCNTMFLGTKKPRTFYRTGFVIFIGLFTKQRLVVFSMPNAVLHIERESFCCFSL